LFILGGLVVAGENGLGGVGAAEVQPLIASASWSDLMFGQPSRF